MAKSRHDENTTLLTKTNCKACDQFHHGLMCSERRRSCRNHHAKGNTEEHIGLRVNIPTGIGITGAVRASKHTLQLSTMSSVVLQSKVKLSLSVASFGKLFAVAWWENSAHFSPIHRPVCVESGTFTNKLYQTNSGNGDENMKPNGPQHSYFLTTLILKKYE